MENLIYRVANSPQPPQAGDLIDLLIDWQKDQDFDELEELTAADRQRRVRSVASFGVQLFQGLRLRRVLDRRRAQRILRQEKFRAFFAGVQIGASRATEADALERELRRRFRLSSTAARDVVATYVMMTQNGKKPLAPRR